MKLLIIFALAAMTLASCSSTRDTYRVENDLIGTKVLIGKISRPVLEQDTAFAWFQKGYQTYVPEAPALEALRALARDLRFVMFIGTWCSDSKAEVPRMFKFFDALSIPADHIVMYGVDHLKKTDSGEPEQYKITKVPTVIVYSGAKEIGRIVEQPREGIEEDIRQMLEKSRQ